jgi:hypothetical protein
MRSENSRIRGVPVPTRPAELTVEVIAPKLEGMVRMRVLLYGVQVMGLAGVETGHLLVTLKGRGRCGSGD